MISTRQTRVGTSQTIRHPAVARHVVAALLPPCLMAAVTWHAEPWQFMCATVVAIYFGLKLLTFSVDAHLFRGMPWRAAGYLLLWPGMDSRAFAASRTVGAPRAREWLLPVALMLLGVVLIPCGTRLAESGWVMPGGWLIVAGFLFELHFGSFELLSLAWRSRGVNARPLMHYPWAATSLTDYWGRRWNTAFRDLAYRFISRPIAVLFGSSIAVTAAFLVSGLVHEAGISLPAGAGWGLPTAYFVLQALGMWFEQTAVGRRLGLGKSWSGRCWTAAVVLLPAPLLFHMPFLERVVVPLGAAVTGR